MYISPINTASNTYNQAPSFCGLTKKFSKVFIDGKKDIVRLLDNSNPSNTYVGKLPPVIYNSLPNAGKREAILDVYKVFGEVANIIREFRPSCQTVASERINRRPESAVKTLKDMLVKHGILSSESPFDIVFLDPGEYKKAFKLEGLKDPKTGDELCLKVYHSVDKSPEWHKYKSHGVYSELNQAVAWQKQNGLETQHTKFYFGELESGFEVDEFIGKSAKKPRREINEYDLGKKSTDVFRGGNGHNHIYDHDIEFGGGRVINRIKNESKIARYVLKRIKETPVAQRDIEWHNLLEAKHLDKRQREAGLAISIKHMENPNKYIDECLAFNNSYADVGLSYVLKYLDEPSAAKYFEILMKRKDPVTQTVLMNEIPLISRMRATSKANFDDLDVPKSQIDPETLEKYYKLAEKYVLPEVEEHLASFVHLLPKDKIEAEADKLIAKNDYHINDRLLHKMKYLKEEDFSTSEKMDILRKLEKAETPETDEFLAKKLIDVRTQVIRNSLDD